MRDPLIGLIADSKDWIETRVADPCSNTPFIGLDKNYGLGIWVR